MDEGEYDFSSLGEGDQSGQSWNIVPPPDVQADTVNNLIDSVSASNLSQPPSLPDGGTNPLNDLLFGKGKTFDDELKSDSANNPLAQANQSIVTHAIANQGQLLPIPGAQPSSNSSTDSDLKKLIQAVSAKSATPAAASPASSSGGGGGGGILGDIGSVVSAVASWIICTELYRQGRMPARWWIVGSKVFANYPEIGKPGYYIWAIPSVRHLRKHPNSLYSLLLCKIFLWRAENIAYACGVRGARKLWRGAFVTAVLFPACYALGIVLAVLRIKVDYTQVYEVQK